MDKNLLISISKLQAGNNAKEISIKVLSPELSPLSKPASSTMAKNVMASYLLRKFLEATLLKASISKKQVLKMRLKKAKKLSFR